MPPAPAAYSIITSSLSTAAAVTKLFTSSSTWTRAFFATASTLTLPSRNVMTATTATTSAFATAAANTATPTDGTSRTANNRNMFTKLASWRPRRLSTLKQRSDSTSSMPSFASSSSSHSAHSDYSTEGGVQRQQSSRRRRRHFSTSKANSEGGSKLSSDRAQAAIKLLPSYLIDARAITQYSPSTPDGALQLSVAENQLSELPVKGMVGIMEDTKAGGVDTMGSKEMRLVDVLSQLASSNIARPSDEGAAAMHVFEREMIYYQPTQGVPTLRTAMASYLQNLLVSPTHPNLATKFDPENLVLGAGCNAVLENLCTVLANPGDAVLIPTPYYAAFEFDLVARAGCHITSVTTFDHHDSKVPKSGAIEPEFYYPNRSSLDDAYARAVEETGRAPRVLLLSHPNNPLGICYPPAVMEECIAWCREKRVHLISDEIYAGSVYRKEQNGESKEDPTFVSAMALGSSNSDTSATQKGLGLGPYVHLVYALSKDFALSGLRVGVAYTENEEILMPLQKLNDLCQISSQTQLLVERMMCANAVKDDGDKSDKFTDVFLNAHQENVRKRCDALQSCLDDVGIPYLPADSGLFVWMDFREFLPALSDGTTEATESVESREQRERKLYLSLMKEYGLLFTPGMSMRNERAGFFRCVFTAASEEEFELGLVRLRKFVEEMRS
mmetsp:Transcript_31644/g.57955  ORF Transcript_31644/g.57955 Transcript_31644/m.57955 type:complete len:671 (+) Transcript_31644:123-2135(+)|eukprot:CAMPEP_0201644974 /NCGR_PEP_ID=MMETSP0493-20130528/31178_1 /ASSEMBLY_ACC=CAM_ASM_000838 /TAXON_ID=420259 /ORGANISM="Thalassiosira gravida, Strain GMp14c1" /LENGTH=670 /DNA_ID=CAMNT_0048119799 /DNA_START=47 /DNA_END=2059 /DNA_ORIENTATION=-